jgi:L-seryl-tRNA(Ser) seleniumtransferase
MHEDPILDLRSLPSVGRLLEECATTDTPHDVLLAAIRAALADARARIVAGLPASRGDLLRRVRLGAEGATAPWPRRVINATGVVLHTNLGRAPLSPEAVRAMQEAAAYSDLEMDLPSGQRGRRDTHVARLLATLTGAEAATVVNNCAGALVLALSALARGREVIVSRGQSVEIGGRFRIPDVCDQSGARLREVGTTNRTYASDYEAAVTEETALLLMVHRSNFHMSGFVADVTIPELAEVARARGLTVLHDLGSGCMVDTARWGLRHEPTVPESVRGGAHLTLFSGDKLLGGPQAGLVVGRRDLVERLRRHPLARALRCDKATLAALHATLLHYLRGEAEERVPALRMLARSPEDIEAQVSSWRDSLGLPGAQVRPSRSAVGGGTLPGSELPSAALVLEPAGWGVGAEELARRLRHAEAPVVGRIAEDLLWLDGRAVSPEEEPDLLGSVRAAVLGREGAAAPSGVRR